jgi:hypothetical protein
MQGVSGRNGLDCFLRFVIDLEAWDLQIGAGIWEPAKGWVTPSSCHWSG